MKKFLQSVQVKTGFQLALLLIASLLLALLKAGISTPLPSSISVISTDELIRLKNQPGILLVDVRPPSVFSEGALPGAVNLPMDLWMNKGLEGARQVVKENGILRFKVIVYCNDEWCPDSRRVANILEKLGVSCLVYQGGYRSWLESH